MIENAAGRFDSFDSSQPLTSLLNAYLTKISKAEVTQPGYVASICIAEGEDDHDVFGNGGD